jgi:hypothetical protein
VACWIVAVLNRSFPHGDLRPCEANTGTVQSALLSNYGAPFLWVAITRVSRK